MPERQIIITKSNPERNPEKERVKVLEIEWFTTSSEYAAPGGALNCGEMVST
jgi:hypothetical protein